MWPKLPVYLHQRMYIREVIVFIQHFFSLSVSSKYLNEATKRLKDQKKTFSFFFAK